MQCTLIGKFHVREKRKAPALLPQMREPVVMSWSGGKDSAVALQELLESVDYEVVELMTTVSEEFRRISHHGVREELLEAQAAAIGLPLTKVYLPSGHGAGCTNDIYEAIMNRVMLAYKARGVKTVAFGDLFLEDLRAWREENLASVGIRGIFPIWKRDTTVLAQEVIRRGYQAYICCVEPRVGGDFVGRLYDEEFLSLLPLAVDPLWGERRISLVHFRRSDLSRSDSRARGRARHARRPALCRSLAGSII